MRYLTLLSGDFNKSVDLFHPADLAENANAARVIAKCMTTEYNPFEWDSSVRFDVTMWTGFELQLFVYGFKMAEKLGDRQMALDFEDLMCAYDEAVNQTSMDRPLWSLNAKVLDSHISYLMSVTQFPAHYGMLFSGKMPQVVPIPLPDSMLRAA